MMMMTSLLDKTLNFVMFRVAMITPGDDFTVTMRKMATAFMLFTNLHSLGFLGYLIYLIQEPSQAQFITSSWGQLFVNALHLIVFTTNYAVLRCRKGKLHPLQMDVTVSIVSWVTVPAMMLFIPEFDGRITAGVIALMAAMSKTKYFWIQMFPLFTMSMVHAYNDAFMEDAYTAFPGARRGQPWEKLLLILSAFSIFCVMILAVRLQTKVHSQHLEASHSINKMAMELVDLLSRYDTSGARRLIDNYTEQLAVEPTQTQEEGTESSFPATTSELDEPEGRGQQQQQGQLIAAEGGVKSISTDNIISRDKKRKSQPNGNNKSTSTSEWQAARRSSRVSETGKMIDAFQRINENLERYKPFLPNYLFQQSSSASYSNQSHEEGLHGHEGGEGEEMGGGGSQVLRDEPLFDIVNRRPPSEDGLSSIGDISDLDLGGSQNNHTFQVPSSTNPFEKVNGLGVGPPPHGPSASLSRGGHRRGWSSTTSLSMASLLNQPVAQWISVTYAVVDIQSRKLQRRLGGSHTNTTSRPTSTPTAPGGGTSMGFASLAQPSSSMLMNTHVVINTIVNIIYSLVKETKASVHSMVGDTVQLSWNATHHVSLPETKGAVFLLMLKEAFSAAAGDGVPLCSNHKQQQHQKGGGGGTTGVAGRRGSSSSPIDCGDGCDSGGGIAGAVWSGEASVHSVISATQQRALVISAPWMPALQASLRLAQRHGAVLMDERTAQGSSLTIEGCPVDKVYLPLCVSEWSGTGDGNNSSRDPAHTVSADPTFLFNHPQRGVSTSTTPAARGQQQQQSSPPLALICTTIFQILCLKERRTDLEWMYQLEESEVKSDSAPETAAATAAAATATTTPRPRDTQLKIIEAVDKGSDLLEARRLLVQLHLPEAGSKQSDIGCLPSFTQAITAQLNGEKSATI